METANDAALQAGDLLTEREAAQVLKTALPTLRNWRAQGKGPRFRKIGERLVRYHRADLADFAQGGQQ